MSSMNRIRIDDGRNVVKRIEGREGRDYHHFLRYSPNNG
jgi:hypothetical protein